MSKNNFDNFKEKKFLNQLPKCVIPYYGSIHKGYIQVVSCQNNILISTYFNNQFKLKNICQATEIKKNKSLLDDNDKFLLICKSCESRGEHVLVHTISCSFANEINNLKLDIDNINNLINNKITHKTKKVKDDDQNNILLNKLIHDIYINEIKNDSEMRNRKINQTYENKKIKDLSKSITKLSLK